MAAEKALIRVMVADDHPVVKEGLVSLIGRQPDMEVVAESSDGVEAVAAFLRCLPDVAVIDLRMPEMDGVSVVLRIRENIPSARIVILSTFDGDESIFRSLRAGAKGYLRKDTSREKLVECIHSVYHGKSWVEPSIAAKLAGRLRESELSPRELQVLQAIAEGKSNREIGEALKIGEGTVKIHVNHVLKKLGVRGRTEAVHAALKRGIVFLQ